MRERVFLGINKPPIQFIDLYDLDLLKRNIERNVNSNKELTDYFNYGKIILMQDKEINQYENTPYEIKKIEKITNSNDTIKIKEQRIIQLILFKCNCEPYYYSYLRKYGDQLEYTGKLFKQPSIQNGWEIKPLYSFIISTMSIKGLQYLIERGYNIELGFQSNLKLHKQCLQTQIINDDWYQFIQLYNNQDKIKITNESYWYKIILRCLILKSTKDNDIIDQLDLFKNFVFQKDENNGDTNFSNGILYDPAVYYETFNDFKTFKWCIQLISNYKETITFRIIFEICSTDEIDFIFSKLKQRKNSINGRTTLPIKSFSLACYFIDQMNLHTPDEPMFLVDQVLSKIVDKSIVECDFKTLLEISEKFSGLQFDFQEQFHFNVKTISPSQLINLFNGLNSIGYKLFRQSKLFGIINELEKYLTNDENAFKDDIQFNEIFKSIDFNSIIKYSMSILITNMVYFKVGLVKLMLSSDKFTFNMKIYKEMIENDQINMTRNVNLDKPSYQEGIELLEYLINKIPNINEAHVLVNHLYKTTIQQTNITDHPIENLKSLIQIHQKLFIDLKIPLKTTTVHLTCWFKLKSLKIYEFIKQYNSFLNSISPMVSQLYIDQFPFTRIINTDGLTLISEFNKLYFKYNKSHVTEYFSFLLQFNYFDLAISIILNQKIKVKSKNGTTNFIDEYIIKLFKSSISISELLSLFQSPIINISNLIQCSISSNRLDIFIHLLSTNDNSTINWFKYFILIEKSMLDFLKYFLENHLSLFLKLSSGENQGIFNFNYPILKNNIECCLLLYKHLPSIFNIKLIESCLLTLDEFGNPLESIKYFKEIGIIPQ